MTTAIATPPLDHRPYYHRRALGLLRWRDTPDWLERLIEEFRLQECSVALDMEASPWDLVVFQSRGELRLVWADDVFFGALFVVQVIHPDRPGSPADSSVLRQLATARGAVPLIAQFQPARPLRDRWKIRLA